MANRNPAIVEILKLAYEFENSVARPDAARNPTPEWFAEALYEPTRLDTELLPDILDDRFDLVLLTGNPGDGKSAFLGQILRSPVTRGGRSILVKHDATEPTDPSDRTASALRDLEEFLRPLSDEGWDPASASAQVFVLGINKGLLARAFLAPSAPFARIGNDVRRALEDTTTDADGPLRLAVVDLNRRAEATFPLSGTDSLFDRLLGRLVSPALLEQKGCEDCDDAGWCPFFGNAKRLRRPEDSSRLKLLWLVQQLRSERHATIRDLLAALAYVIVGHEDMFREGDEPTAPIIHPCAFVEREAVTRESLALFRRVLYNSTFVDGDIYEGKATTIEPHVTPSSARTFGMAPLPVRAHLNSLDPASGLSNETWDGIEERILVNPRRALDRAIQDAGRDGFELERQFFERMRDSMSSVSRALDEVEPSDARYGQLVDDYQWLTYLVITTLKRRAFFSTDGRLTDLTRYASLELFLGALEYAAGTGAGDVEAFEEASLAVVPRGLMRSEGVTVIDERPRRLEIRWSSIRGEVGAVLVVSLDSAELRAEPLPARYIEAFPERLIFQPVRTERRIRLDMSLDTFEGLFRLAQGYHEGYSGVPRTSQLRNFREALRGLGPEEMIILDFADPTFKVLVTMRGRMRFD